MKRKLLLLLLFLSHYYLSAQYFLPSVLPVFDEQIASLENLQLDFQKQSQDLLLLQAQFLNVQSQLDESQAQLQIIQKNSEQLSKTLSLSEIKSNTWKSVSMITILIISLETLYIVLNRITNA